jgi:hypothetical protein
MSEKDDWRMRAKLWLRGMYSLFQIAGGIPACRDFNWHIAGFGEIKVVAQFESN